MSKRLAMLMVSFLAFIGTVMAATLNPAMESASGTQELSPMTEAPKAGDRIMLKNRQYDNWMGLTTNWTPNALCGKETSLTYSDASLIWELQNASEDGFYLYNESQNVYAGPVPGWEGFIAVTTEAKGAGIYKFEQYKFEQINEEVLYYVIYNTQAATYLCHSDWDNKEIIRADSKASEASHWTIYKVGESDVDKPEVDDPEINDPEVDEPITEDTNLYALQSPSGTFFNFTPVTVEGNTTLASFQSTPSFIYVIPGENDACYLQSLENESKYIGCNHDWLVTDYESLWNISEPTDGYVTISRYTDASKRLGHDGNTDVGTAIFTNGGDKCFKWKLVPAYPITINYYCDDKLLETVKGGAIAGTSYTAKIDMKGGTLVSCVADNGEIEVGDGLFSIAEVNGARTVTITLQDAKNGGEIVIDDWKFEYEYVTNGIMLSKTVERGNANLVIPNSCNINGVDRKIVAISPTFLHGETTLETIKLPASLVNLGFREIEPMFVGKYEGQNGDYAQYNESVYPPQVVAEKGMNRCFVFPNDPTTGKPFVVSKDFAWKLTLDVTIDETEGENPSFTKWGSAIVSTKENSLDDDYTKFMQIYLWKDLQHIVVKIDNADDRYAYSTPALDGNGNPTNELYVNRHFVFELEHDGTGGYQVVINFGNGKSQMYTISASEDNKVGEFDRFYYSLPEQIHVNVKLEKLITHGLFVGCTNLTKIEVEEANTVFKACDHGVLYDKNGYYVMRIPEGDPGTTVEGRSHFEIPSKVVKLYPGAVHGVDADIVLHSNPQIGVVKGHEEDVKNAKFYLSLDDIDSEYGNGGALDFNSNNTNTYVSANYKRAPIAKDKYGTIILPFKSNNMLAKYDFYKFVEGDKKGLTFEQVETLEANTPYLYKLKETSVEATAEEGETAQELDVFVSDGGVTIEPKGLYYPGTEAPGTYNAVGVFTNYHVTTGDYPNSYYYFLSNSTNLFHRVTQRLNYRPYRVFFVVNPAEGQSAELPARLNLRLLDGTTTEIDSTWIEGMGTPEYYDLSGRRVLNPTNGVYIVNGKKVLMK